MPNENIKTDALIIGAGPCGLFQVFELGLLGIESIVIDSLPSIGGQCTELYPDKPIYDIPGIPVCTGEELIDNLSKQIEPFSPKLILGDEVIELERKDESFEIKTQKGKSYLQKPFLLPEESDPFNQEKLDLRASRNMKTNGCITESKTKTHSTVRKSSLLEGETLHWIGPWIMRNPMNTWNKVEQ